MKFLKFAPLLVLLVLFSCNKDDNNTPKTDPPRDEGEVYQENMQAIKTFLETHFYTVVTDSSNHNYKHIVFDTIAGENSGETAIMDSPALKSKKVAPGNFEYTLYYLQVRKGAESEYQPTFADKIALDYTAMNFKLEKFDQTFVPKVLDLTLSQDIIITKGIVRAIAEFKGASQFTQNADGTVSYANDFGIGAVFIPSGLGYFQSPPVMTGLQSYEPFVVRFRLFKAIQMDHDNDGVPSYMEDINDNKYLLDDDTDLDGIKNYKDSDDDGDGQPTMLEITVSDANNDGIITEDEITLPDSNNSGKPDYLNPAVY